MQTLIHNGKYQIQEILHKQEGFRACLCIDVETNNHYKPMVFNIYENDDDIRRYLPLFFTINKGQCPDYLQVMSGEHTITAVFEYHGGERLADFFSRVDKYDFALRMKYATLLMKEFLMLDAVDDIIACSALNQNHIRVMEKDESVRLNFILMPYSGEVPAHFKPHKLAEFLCVVFKKNRYVPELLWDFVDELKNNKHDDFVAAYSVWKSMCDRLEDEHEELKKESLWMYALRRIKGWLMAKR